MWQIALALYLLLTGIRHLINLGMPGWVDGLLAILAAILIMVSYSFPRKA